MVLGSQALQATITRLKERVADYETQTGYDFEELSGDIYIGGSASETILSVAADLRREYPGVRFHFYSGDAQDVLERLNHGSLDFAVMLEPVDNIKYEFVSLPDCSQWGVLMNKSDALAAKKALTKEDIKNSPLIMHQRIGQDKK